MGVSVDGAFAEVLARHRERYNARYSHARRMRRAPDPDDFGRHLAASVAPVVNAVAETDADAATVEAVSHALYDLSLELVAAELAGPGARHPVMNWMWTELLPIVADHLVEEPIDLVAALSNALFNLASEPTVDAREWLDRMLDVAPATSDREELLQVGMVLAWRCGMAHFRESALDHWRTLDESLQKSTLGTAADPTGHRWQRSGSDAEPTLAIVTHVGAFRGLGGTFDSPPRVMQFDGRLFASDGSHWWSVHADRFGATMRRFGVERPTGESLETPFRLAENGTVTRGELTGVFEELVGASSWAANEETMLVATPRNHVVFVVAAS